MQLYQYFRYDQLTASSIPSPPGEEPIDMRGWLQSQIMLHPLTSAEVDHDYIHDPSELLLNEGTLVRDELICLAADIAEAWGRVNVDNGIRGIMHSPDWSIRRRMVGEIPPDTTIYHHAKSLTYSGRVGVLGKPKEFTFSMNAFSPADAWRKVILRLEAQGFSRPTLLLHDIGLSSTTFHDLTTRAIEEVDGCADQSTYNAWKILAKQEDKIISHLSSLGSLADHDFFLEMPFLLRKLMVDYGLVGREQQIDYQRLAHAVREAWRMEDSINAILPRRLLPKEGFFGEQGEQLNESSEMFSFTSEEEEALKVPPSIRFLVTRNIPSNAGLTLRDQQAWCNFYLAKNV